MKKLFLLVTALLALCLITGCTEEPVQTNPQTTPTPSQTESTPQREYIWDITVAYCNFDVHEHGEAVPAVTLTHAAAREQMLRFDAAGLTQEDLMLMLDEENRLLFSDELRVTEPASAVVEDPAAWILDDGGAGVTMVCQVVTPLTEGDYDTHGELLVKLVAPDYVWNVEVIFQNGACGEYVFTNPGLSGWESYGQQYMNQSFTATPENPTAQLFIFNHQQWIVDNTRSWYKWVVFDVIDECPNISYEVVQPLTMGDRKTPGTLKIYISLP